jgi:hypothetical protein
MNPEKQRAFPWITRVERLITHHLKRIGMT